MTSRELIAKAGPGPDNYAAAKNERDKGTGLSSLHQRFLARGGFGWTMTKRMRNHSADVRFAKVMMASVSNTSSYENQIQNWRVSVGASARRVPVAYVPNLNACTHHHSWGTYGDIQSAAAELSDSYQGSRTVIGGQPGAHYNAKEAAGQAKALAEKIGLKAGTQVNTTVFWYTIMYNIAQVVLSTLEGNGFVRPIWQNRPTNPSTYDHVITGLNHYNNHVTNMMVGERVTIELDQPEVDLIPYIDFLLGAGPNTFTWAWGQHDGNDRQPHLISKTPVRFSYGYLIRDNLNAGPATPINPALPGLAAGLAIPANTVVGNFDWDLINRALMVLARSMPVASDIEAACIKVAIDVFAEPYRGVLRSEVCGADNNNWGYNAFFDQNTVMLPSGNVTCCVGTLLTENLASTASAQTCVHRCSDMIRDVGGFRAIAEMHILMLQMSCRQLGVTIPMSFPLVATNTVYNANVPAANVTAATMGGLLADVAVSNRDYPSELMLTQSMLMEVAYNAVLPETALYFEYGNRPTDPADSHCPLLGEANIGECFVSVHAAQTVNGLLTVDAIGLAGIPNRLDAIAQETEILFTGMTKPTVDGESKSRLDANGAADCQSGVHMLGHATLFLRDDNLVNGDVFEVEVAGFIKEGKEDPKTRALAVSMDVVGRNAFSQDGTFNDQGTHLLTHSLYADFDRQRFSDLRLTLPNSSSVASYGNDPIARRRVPGFVGAMIANSFKAMTGNIGVTLKQRSTKRARITGPASTLVIKRDKKKIEEIALNDHDEEADGAGDGSGGEDEDSEEP